MLCIAQAETEPKKDGTKTILTGDIMDFFKQEEVEAQEKNYTTRTLKKGETFEADKLSFVIICDISKNGYPQTSSGKSLSVASSHGFEVVEGSSLKLSLNLTSKLPS